MAAAEVAAVATAVEAVVILHMAATMVTTVIPLTATAAAVTHLTAAAAAVSLLTVAVAAVSHPTAAATSLVTVVVPHFAVMERPTQMLLLNLNHLLQIKMEIIILSAIQMTIVVTTQRHQPVFLMSQEPVETIPFGVQTPPPPSLTLLLRKKRRKLNHSNGVGEQMVTSYRQ